MTFLSFEWDEKKNIANQKKHGVSFEEAKSVFYDEQAMEFSDPAHPDDETRFLMVGHSHRFRLLVVCHCYREVESVIRIISARKLTSKERHTLWGE
jgi:uncharacterized protein